MPLIEHVYRMTTTFKMTVWVEQWTCTEVEHSSVETIWMIQKAAALGNWWLAASSLQCTHSRTTSPAKIFCKTWNHPHDSALLQPRFGALWLLALTKIKITFEREEISDCQWYVGKHNGAADDDWENHVRSRGLLWRGLRCHCPM